MSIGEPRPFLGREKRYAHTADDLGLVVPISDGGTQFDALDHLEAIEILPDDRLVLEVSDLLESYGGVIFVGPPGTSKSWYAAAIAVTLAGGNAELVRFVQFHPSYQYEDFVEGYVPDEQSHFVLRPKHLLEMCATAEEHPNEMAFLVIDELSRADPGRVFGEALTYIEKSKRGQKFRLASGTATSVPPNLHILATMNPQDRGVDEVDAAFERRFAKIEMPPRVGILREFLEEAGLPEVLTQRVEVFFRTMNGRASRVPGAAIGHTFFRGVGDEEALRSLWDHQLKFLLKKAYVLDADGFADAEKAWNQIFLSDSRGLNSTDGNADSPSPETT